MKIGRLNVRKIDYSPTDYIGKVRAMLGWIKAVSQALVETYQDWRAKSEAHRIDKLKEKVTYETPTAALKAEEMKERAKLTKINTGLVKTKTSILKIKSR